MTWVDSHAHLTMVAEDELAGVLARAAAAGVERVLVPATNAADLDRTVALAGAHGERVVAAVGVHPHDASSLDEALKRRLERALAAPGVVAVGEIGLDYHYMSSPREDQLRALQWQLDLALEHRRPVVLHNRESFTDLVASLADRGGAVSGVCHSFTESPEAVGRVVELGLYVGFSGMVTFRNAAAIRDAVRTAPGDRLLLETDSPYLAPEPYRGRPNEPAYVPHVAQRVARERAVTEAELATSTTANFAALFLGGECGSASAGPSADARGGGVRPSD